MHKKANFTASDPANEKYTIRNKQEALNLVLATKFLKEELLPDNDYLESCSNWCFKDEIKEIEKNNLMRLGLINEAYYIHEIIDPDKEPSKSNLHRKKSMGFAMTNLGDMLIKSCQEKPPPTASQA